MSGPAGLPCVTLFGIRVAALTSAQALDTIEDAIGARRPLHIGVINAAKVVNMRRDRELQQSVLASDVVFADGMSIVWASRMLGKPLPERVAGIDLMTGILERGRQRRHRVFCLGATPDVLAKTVAAIEARFPGVVVAGSHHGYFTQSEEGQVAEIVAASRADVLFVAMTSPKKEQFLARWAAHMGVPVCHGVGGSFDVLAGKVERAPQLWQKLGLEWLYRVKQEPRRLWRRYLTTNVLFLALTVRELFSRAVVPRTAS